MPKMKITQVEESNKGLYVWQMPNDSIVTDDKGNFLSIPSIKGDIIQIKKLKDAAKHYGLDEGKPLFFPGHRQITDEELEEQKARSQMGLVPDPQDLPAMMEYVKDVKEMGLG